MEGCQTDSGVLQLLRQGKEVVHHGLLSGWVVGEGATGDSAVGKASHNRNAGASATRALKKKKRSQGIISGFFYKCLILLI